MAKPIRHTILRDTCQCGSALYVESPDAERALSQHIEWLDAHAPCQEWHDHWWERLRLWIAAKITPDTAREGT